jgi:hypothetical protein
LDRGTDRPDGSGGGTPTVVTSRATADDLTGDERETRPSGVMAPPRQPSPKPTAARSASADAESQDDAVSGGTAGSGVPVNGASASGKDSSANRGPAAVDDTIVDGVPALPADTIGSARGTRSKGSDPGEEPTQSAADDSPVASFGPRPSAPAAADWTAAGAAKPSGGDPPTAPLGTAPSGVRSSGPGSSGTVPPGRRPSPADSPAVSPASFAWEMSDPPSNSTSSPARNFLRSGLTIRGATAKGTSSGTSQAATDEGLATARGTAQKPPPQQAPSPQPKAKKAKSKRAARQAHLTIARVEPWSVMKFSFVVSLVAFVILFVAVSLLYGVLSAVGVFDSLQRVVTSITSSQASGGVNAKAWFSASKVLGYTALLGSLNIVLITAMATIGSVVYNLTSRLVGGVEVTLRETE